MSSRPLQHGPSSYTIKVLANHQGSRCLRISHENSSSFPASTHLSLQQQHLPKISNQPQEHHLPYIPPTALPTQPPGKNPKKCPPKSSTPPSPSQKTATTTPTSPKSPGTFKSTPPLSPPTPTNPPHRYYHQRHSLFTLYSTPPGIHLTDTAWFGVTPEPVAQQIAHDLSPPSPSSTIIDIFAGAGGNTIAFALSRKWTHIIAIERDASTLACAQHNAQVYGVYEAITWILGDSFEVLALLRGIQRGERSVEGRGDELSALLGDMHPSSTVVFASPPWGGVSYADTEVFDLGAMEPYSLGEIHEACREMRHVLFLPRNSDVRQVAGLVRGESKVDVVQYCMFGASKGMVAYIPGEEETGR